MKKKKIKVAVVFNEPSPESYIKPAKLDKKQEFIPYFEVNELTPVEEYELLTGKLNKSGFRAYSLNIEDDILLLLKDLEKNKPDLVFNFIEIYKENSRYEMNVVSLLELLRVPYTGAPPITLANCQNKVLTKRLLSSLGIRTPDFFLVKKLSKNYRHNLKFPLMIKPGYEDASVGIENESIVKNNKQLKERVDYVLQYFLQPVLVEEYIEGRELNIAVLGDTEPEALPISEIDFTKMPDHLYNIVSYQAKWNPSHEAYHKTIPVCPARLPKKTEQKAKETALTSFKVMGCRDYARVDIRLTPKGKLYVLEVNPNPDLTEGAGFMRSAEAAGYSYIRALKRIIDLAYKRAKRDSGKRYHLSSS
jgi:D-alanine-D-alanine ligase